MQDTGDYISRDAVIEKCERLRDKCGNDEMAFALNWFLRLLKEIPAADVRPVTVCTNCEHNNHCLTQEFVDDCGKIPLGRNTFFCADGERRSNA